MSLDTLQIINYQPHKESILHFSPGVNVIKGTSHEGKSSIARAFDWLIENEPKGEGFKSYFASKEDEVLVAGEFNNGTVVRQRDNKINCYIVNDEDPLEALKTGVPEEVKRVTQMDAINIQMQDDGYFLLTDPPGQVAKSLNEAVGLEIIDLALKKAESKIRKIKSKEEETEKDIKDKKEEISTYEILDDIAGRIMKLDELLLTIDQLSIEEENLSSILQSLDTEIKEKEKVDKILEAEPMVIKLKEKGKEIQNLETEEEELSLLLFKIKTEYAQVRKIKLWLKIEEPYKRLVIEAQDIETLERDKRELFDVCSSISEEEMSLNSLNSKLEKLEEQRRVVKKQLDKCPTCGALRIHWTKEI